MASTDRLQIHARLYHRRKTDKPAALLGWAKQSMTACSELLFVFVCVCGALITTRFEALIDAVCASLRCGVDLCGSGPQGCKHRHGPGIVVAEVVVVVAAAAAAAVVALVAVAVAAAVAVAVAVAVGIVVVVVAVAVVVSVAEYGVLRCRRCY